MSLSDLGYKTQPFTQQGLTYMEDFLSKIEEPHHKEILSLLENSIRQPNDIRKRILSNAELQEAMIFALSEHFKGRAPLDDEIWRIKRYTSEHLILLLKMYSSQIKGFGYTANRHEVGYLQVIEYDFPCEERKLEEDHSKDQIFFR